MNNNGTKYNGASRLILTVATPALVMGLILAAPAPALAGGHSGQPDLSIGAREYPDADAIILRWQQHWTLEGNGTVHRRNHYWVKLFNSRTFDRYGDPRLDFAEGRDELLIHSAKSYLPDGTVLPVPDYSFNAVGPDDVAGWPEYTDWQQIVVSFSGIEPGVVLELDYEVVTPPKIMPWIDGDVRLHDEYPIVERMVTVTVPSAMPLHHRVEGIPPRGMSSDKRTEGDSTTYEWVFPNLASDLDEPQSPARHERGGRLRFSTCKSGGEWVSAILSQVNQAARPVEAIRDFAESAVEDEADPALRVRKIAKKLHDSFNVIHSPKARGSLQCRQADQVLRSNYGNPLESAALCLAAIRSLGITGSLRVGVNATRWNDVDGMIPTNSAFDGVIVVAELADETLYVHPERGVFANPGDWGRRWLLGVDDGGSVAKTYVYARGEEAPSEIHIAGKISIDTAGEATGDLRIRATGAFFDPTTLETTDAQKSLVEDFVGRVLHDFNVPGYSVTTLSEETFRATASVASDGKLKGHDKVHLMHFGDGPAFLPDVPMPLGRSYRRTDVKLAGRFQETVDLTIELPEEWSPSILPTAFPAIGGPWGTVVQTIDVDGRIVRLRRSVAVTTKVLSPAVFEKVRGAVNDLRATRSLLLGVGPEVSGE